MSRPIRFHHWILLLIVALGAFLLLMPTKVEPVAWTPQPAPSLSSGLYADNQRLKGVAARRRGEHRRPRSAAAGKQCADHRLA